MGRRRLDQSPVIKEERLEAKAFRQRVNSEPIKNEMLDSLDKTPFLTKPIYQGQHSEPSERRSSRAIRRKKFDDEVLDNSNAYSKKKIRTFSESISFTDDNLMKENFIDSVPDLKKPERLFIRAKIEDVFVVSKVPVSDPLSSPKIEQVEESDGDEILEEGTLITERCEKSEFPKPHMFESVYNFWTPQDDLTLIVNMNQTCDSKLVFESARFTQNFTFGQIVERWYQLLYDRVTSNISIQAIRQLHKSIISNIEKESIFSAEEDSILKQIPSKIRFSYKNFQKVLSNNQDIFLSSREPEDLFKRWTYLHSNHLLNDQTDLLEKKLTIFDNKPNIQYKEANTSVDELEDKQVCLRRLLDSKIVEFRVLQNEINYLTTMASIISGIHTLEFEPEVYAYLRGTRVRFLIKTEEVTLGRSTKDIQVDCDLTREGFSKHISRFQAVINLLPMGRFLIYNAGSHQFFVNSQSVGTEEAAELLDESIVQFDDMTFLFRINKPKIAREYSEGIKGQLAITP